MTITIVEKRFGDKHDPDFNEKAAREAYELVTKMAPDEARAFIEHVVSDVLAVTIEKNRRSLQGHLDKVVSKRIERIKKAAIRQTVAKSEGAVEFAQALTVIEKATKNQFVNANWDESKYRRDTGGRFSVKIKPGAAPSNRVNQRIGIPAPPGNEAIGEVTRARYRSEYMQLADFLDRVGQTGISQKGDSQVALHLRDRGTGERITTFAPMSREGIREAWNPQFESLEGAEVRPTGLNVGGAAYDLTGSLGAAQATNAVDRNFSSFAEDWTRATDPRDPNRRTYDRVRAGSQLLGAVGAATGAPHLAAAAKFGEFVGSHGAEAEAVFGPPIRRLAYRYRGTEKVPDREMTREYGIAVGRAKSLSHDVSRLSPQQRAAYRVGNDRRAPSFDEREAGREVVIRSLAQDMPTSKLYGLHLAAGNTPPSEGVIIDSEGRIAGQASGYGDDHYLPFNLRNLQDLKDGEYIRTRSVGGPTTEDIYTGLMSGARQMTVISRSGQYTVTFEPDFRGGRRHNDKAKRMVSRYASILDAIQSEQVERQPVDQLTRRGIEQQVKEKFAGVDLSRSAFREEVESRIADYKANPDMSQEDEALLDIINTYKPEGRDEKEWVRSNLARIQNDKEYSYRLNAQGYQAALEALQEQFPYYLTVKDHKPLHEGEQEKPGTRDKGYVAPNEIRPGEAGAGLYGRRHSFKATGGKISAAEVGNRQVRRSGGGGGEGPENPDDTPAPPSGPAPKSRVAAAIAAQKGSDNARTAALQINEAFDKTVLDSYPTLKVGLTIAGDEEKFRSWYQSNAEQFANDVASVRMAHAADLAGDARAGLRTAMESVEAPKPEVDDEALRAKLPELDRVQGVSSAKMLTSMTADELEREKQLVTSLKSKAAGLGDLSTAELADLGKLTGVTLPYRFVSEAAIKQHAENVDTMLSARKGSGNILGPNATLKVERAPSTEEEQMASKAKVSSLITQFQDAAASYEQMGREREANDLRIAAGGLKESMKGTMTAADADGLFDAYKEEIDLATRAAYERKQAGPILKSAGKLLAL